MTNVKKLTVAQTVAVSKLLEEHCENVNGFATYKNGWSDEKIRQHLDLPTPAGVARVRRELIGDLSRGGKSADSISTRVEVLEAKVAAMEETLLRALGEIHNPEHFG